MEKYTKNYIKFVVAIVVCILVRLIPFRPPNVEPILATNMPFAKVYGPVFGFMFSFFSIILFDVITGRINIWSFLIATTYGVLGILAYYFFLERKPSVLNYILFSIFGTLFFDSITGLGIGPIFFHQPFMQALMGQIPFTLWHLVGNIAFASTVSPLVYELVAQNHALVERRIINSLDPKII
jgi:uncharacterized membrane protein